MEPGSLAAKVKHTLPPCLPPRAFLIRFEMAPVSVFFKLWFVNRLHQNPWMVIKTVQVSRPPTSLGAQIPGVPRAAACPTGSGRFWGPSSLSLSGSQGRE